MDQKTPKAPTRSQLSPFFSLFPAYVPLRRPDGDLTVCYQFAGFPLRTGKSAVNAWLPFQSSTVNNRTTRPQHATYLPPSGRTFFCWAADFDQFRLSAARLFQGKARSISSSNKYHHYSSASARHASTCLDTLRRRSRDDTECIYPDVASGLG